MFHLIVKGSINGTRVLGISTGCFYALQMSFRRIFMIRLAVFSASHAMGAAVRCHVQNKKL